ncbi:cytochrome-c peroxidase [Actibacterium pelagium]|nr:cytochrome c peroxidase [Actibacterium pelagium]
MHRHKLRKNLTNIATGSLFLASLFLSVPQAYAVELPDPIRDSDYRPFDPVRAKLGQLLFYDKILSGNRNISCSTCHAIEHGTSDGLPLGIGEGGIGVGHKRRFADGADKPFKRVPRNSPALFNLGHKSISVMFHDGRVTSQDSYGVGFNTPVEEWLPEGLQSIVAAQALMPLTSEVEMAGSREENEVAAAANRRIDNVWPALVARVAAVPEYVDLFVTAYPDIEVQADITAVHIANALDDFQSSEWRSTASPFDAYLNGDIDALTDQQTQGMELFYGKANCSTCHSGPLLTDQQFHALAVPPFGPGRVRKFDPYARDVGRMSETDQLEDAYRFRTPSLRNVTLTGPWGHNGAFGTLEATVRHHLDPEGSFKTWSREQVQLPPDPAFAATDFVIWEDQREISRIKAKYDIQPVGLLDVEVKAILSFLEALTDDGALNGRLGKPEKVPSGLPID